MNRNLRAVDAVLGIAGSLALAGCGGLPDRSYAALEDGASWALSTTFSFSAGVANWWSEPAEPQAPACNASRRG
jgi:hypothetical protein